MSERFIIALCMPLLHVCYDPPNMEPVDNELIIIIIPDNTVGKMQLKTHGASVFLFPLGTPW
jgi:hypothetical protein